MGKKSFLILTIFIFALLTLAACSKTQSEQSQVQSGQNENVQVSSQQNNETVGNLTVVVQKVENLTNETENLDLDVSVFD